MEVQSRCPIKRGRVFPIPKEDEKEKSGQIFKKTQNERNTWESGIKADACKAHRRWSEPAALFSKAGTDKLLRDIMITYGMQPAPKGPPLRRSSDPIPMSEVERQIYITYGIPFREPKNPLE